MALARELGERALFFALDVSQEADWIAMLDARCSMLDARAIDRGIVADVEGVCVR